jgi:hypothetical protein
MKKTLLTIIAALFLATGTAHAYPPRYYDCGAVFLRIQTGAGSVHNDDGTYSYRVFPTEWKIIENYKVTQPDTDDKHALAKANAAWGKNPSSLNLKCTDTGNSDLRDKCRFNGKLCRKMSDEQWKQEFRGEDD